MRKMQPYIFWLTIFVGASLQSCQDASDKDMDLGTFNSVDTLFLGLKFGMVKKDFFDTCWQLNQRKIVQNDGYNLSVRYKTGDLLDYPAFMNYYPDWEDNQIVSIPVKFHYEGWAPWNKQLWSDKLIIDVKDLLTVWYGGGWKIIKDDPDKKGFLKIDGPRKIELLIVDDQHVEATISNSDYPLTS